MSVVGVVGFALVQAAVGIVGKVHFGIRRVPPFVHLGLGGFASFGFLVQFPRWPPTLPIASSVQRTFKQTLR